jgi:hypothetical protein
VPEVVKPALYTRAFLGSLPNLLPVSDWSVRIVRVNARGERVTRSAIFFPRGTQNDQVGDQVKFATRCKNASRAAAPKTVNLEIGTLRGIFRKNRQWVFRPAAFSLILRNIIRRDVRKKSVAEERI